MAVDSAPARIGKTVVICGEVKGSEDLIIDGRVEGTVSLAENRLIIGPTAEVSADLSAKDVLIQGRVHGNVVASGTQQITLPVLLPPTAASCEIIDLVLGPLDLNLLGLEVHLDTVHLNITAVPGPGNLLGNLLCAIAGLLDGPSPLSGIAALLNRVLAILG